MFIAADSQGQRVQAGRDLAAGVFSCPMCECRVFLRRGVKVNAHFAHAPGSDCPTAEGDSWRHLLAKQVLAEEFATRGYRVMTERPRQAEGRRVDVAVAVEIARGRYRLVAVEVQDAAIRVDTMKARTRLDRQLGYDATAWLFTSHPAAALMNAAPDVEVRIPAEMLWVARRFNQGMPVIDPVQEKTRSRSIAVGIGVPLTG
ncbi:competence protein CoiA family protein [Kitasatospora sp. NPDC051914]|uniref:competence protein CoiA n=1 Tax=Kitasatospora sp. NPDC051914 TaxID=3154945 RepID=UPI00342B3BC9